MRQWYFFVFLTLGIVSFSCQEEGERPLSEPDKGFLKGTVTNEFGQLLGGASIEIDLGSSKIKTSTSEDGEYDVGGVLAGERSVSVSLESFIGQTKKTTIEKDTQAFLDFELKAGDSFLNISDSVFQVQFSDDELLLQINSNSTWIVESTSPWIRPSITNGSGNEELILEVDSNEGDENREGFVWLNAGELKLKIRVSQIAKATIRIAEPILGYINLSQLDSVRILFNNPVNILSIEATYFYCSPNFPFNFIYSADRKSVTFEYSCGDPGESYEFILKFQDDYGSIYTEKFEVDFFDNKLVLDGLIHRKFLSKNENSIWILTYSNNLLYKINLDDFSIQKRFQLPNDIPNGFAINDYKSEIYLYYLGKSVIDIFDKDSFTHKRRIDLQPDPLDHPEHPVKYPYNLQFLSNGLGVLSLQSNSSSAQSWKLIDSRDGDRISIHPQFGEFGNDFVPVADHINLNFDHTKMYLMSGNRFTSFAVLEQGTNRIKIVKSNYEFFPILLLPNRKNNNLIFLQNYVQSIFNPISGEEQLKYDLPSFTRKGTDFTYHPEKPLMTYYYYSSYLAILDYSSGEYRAMQMRYNGITDIVSSLNGDNLFLIKSIGNPYQDSDHYATELYRVPTAYFLNF